MREREREIIVVAKCRILKAARKASPTQCVDAADATRLDASHFKHVSLYIYILPFIYFIILSLLLCGHSLCVLISVVFP